MPSRGKKSGLAVPLAYFITRGTDGKNGWVLQILAGAFAATGSVLMVLLFFYT